MYNGYNKNKARRYLELDDSSNNTIQKTGNEIAYEQQLVVCVLDIPTIETMTGIESRRFDRIDVLGSKKRN